MNPHTMFIQKLYNDYEFYENWNEIEVETLQISGILLQQYFISTVFSEKFIRSSFKAFSIIWLTSI